MRYIKQCSIIILSIMLLYFNVFAYDDIYNELRYDSQYFDVLNIPEVLDYETIKNNNHIERVQSDQDELNIIKYKNNDNTVTSYLFAEDVQYVDEYGNTRDKSNILFADNFNNYYNVSNDIKYTFPNYIEDGITLSYDNNRVIIIPNINTYTNVSKNASMLSYKDISKKSNFVEYKNIFGDYTTLKYTPLYSGFKEDIILDKYNDINEFSFTIYTNGLTLMQEDEYTLNIFDNINNRNIFDISQIEVYDNVHNYSIGTYKVETIIPNYEYIITMIIDVEFLTAENTEYPVTIDPIYRISSFNGSNKQIYDSPLYSNLPNAQSGGSYYNNVGYMDNANYGYSRSVTRFPRLISYMSENQLTENDIKYVYYYTYCKVKSAQTAQVIAYQYNGTSNWSESTITSGNSGMSYGTSYSNISINSTGLWGFNITSAAKNWISNSANASKGIILKNTNETDYSYFLRFASTETSSSDEMPYLQIDHVDKNYTIKVTNSSNSPISGATVYLYYDYSSITKITDSNGIANFGDLSQISSSTKFGFNVEKSGYYWTPSPEYAKSSFPANKQITISIKSKPYSLPCIKPIDSMQGPSVSLNQHFGWRTYGGLDYHTGVDISKNASGSSFSGMSTKPGVKNITAGYVERNGEISGMGYVVQIKSSSSLNGNTQYITYAHLNSIDPKIPPAKSSTKVNQSDLIGVVGKTGATGEHLHISVSTSPSVSKSDKYFLDPNAFFPY